jgi:hypothetical protein
MLLSVRQFYVIKWIDNAKSENALN